MRIVPSILPSQNLNMLFLFKTLISRLNSLRNGSKPKQKVQYHAYNYGFQQWEFVPSFFFFFSHLHDQKLNFLEVLNLFRCHTTTLPSPKDVAQLLDASNCLSTISNPTTVCDTSVPQARNSLAFHWLLELLPLGRNAHYGSLKKLLCQKRLLHNFPVAKHSPKP